MERHDDVEEEAAALVAEVEGSEEAELGTAHRLCWIPSIDDGGAF